MNMHPKTINAIIIIMIIIICIALIQAIYYKSLLGLFCAVFSIVALKHCLKLMKQLKELE